MVKTTRLGGTASDVVVAKVAHGLMTMTIHTPVPDEQAFDSIKSGVDALPPGAKMVLNSGEFYGKDWSLGNLEMLARFYEKYPDYAEKTFLSVKGGHSGYAGSGAELKEKVRASVERCVAALRGTKKIDLFQPARLERGVSIEELVGAFVELLKEGKFEHLGLSECKAESLRRAHAVYPISIAEIEISPMSYEEETKKVIATAKELDVAIAAYSCVFITTYSESYQGSSALSPLGRGLTTGTIQTAADLAKSPFSFFSRFKEENWQYNKRLVDALSAMAAKKGCTPAQLSIAWVASLGEKVIPLPGSSRKERTLENLAGADVELSQADLDEIAQIQATNPVHGDRYFGNDEAAKLWG
ncbi:aldo/keto reductase [Earliella scabrosa]|nr:aldo/keto reductase [Earliella scabrosa]